MAVCKHWVWNKMLGSVLMMQDLAIKIVTANKANKQFVRSVRNLAAHALGVEP